MEISGSERIQPDSNELGPEDKKEDKTPMLNSMITKLGADPLKQINRLQIYESKFYELTHAFKILQKRNAAIENCITNVWPDQKFGSMKDIDEFSSKLSLLVTDQKIRLVIAAKLLLIKLEL
jgi:hypothetical protein